MFEAFRTTAVTIQRLLNHYDSAINRNYDDVLTHHPPIFIVGSPRTGSTLLYQLLLSQFQMSYISNAMALMPMHMVKLAKLYPNAATGFVGAYKENKYGYVAGLFSPNEAGKIIRKWFADIEQNQHQAEVRQTVRALSAITNAPFILKNQRRLTINLPILLETFPEARFIITDRDARFAAQSMLIARRDFTGDDGTWWNAKPDGYESVLDRDPIYQVLWQVLRLQEIARTTLQPLMDNGQVIIVRYEDLCADPKATFSTIKNHFSLSWRDEPEALQPLKVSKRIRLTDEEWQKMETYYKDLSTMFPFVDYKSTELSNSIE